MTSTPIVATDATTIPGSTSDVWCVLADIGRYPLWWPKSVRVRVTLGATAIPGTELEIRPFGGRPFRCRVESVEEPRRIAMRYVGGFIEGRGEWTLEPLGRETRVTYRLDVRAQGRLVVLLGRVLDLAALHSRLMRSILANLRREVADERGRTPERP